MVKQPPRKKRKERLFPAVTFEEALTIPHAIQKYAAGQKVRRLTVFEKLNAEPDSALQDSETGDNPISLYYPSAKLTWDSK